MAAPLESLMVPTIVPVNDWANVTDGARTSAADRQDAGETHADLLGLRRDYTPVSGLRTAASNP